MTVPMMSLRGGWSEVLFQSSAYWPLDSAGSAAAFGERAERASPPKPAPAAVPRNPRRVSLLLRIVLSLWTSSPEGSDSRIGFHHRMGPRYSSPEKIGDIGAPDENG